MDAFQEHKAGMSEIHRNEAKQIVGLFEEPDRGFDLPKKIKIRHAEANRDVRVKICGWVDECNRQRVTGNVVDLVLRDGTGYLHCQIMNKMTGDEAPVLSEESAIAVCGVIKKVSEGTEVYDNYEMKVDFWEMIGDAPSGAHHLVDEDTSFDSQYANRHMIIRGRTVSKVLKMKSVIVNCLRQHYFDRQYFEVHPPTMVQTRSENGTPFFTLDYFGREAYLTVSSQMYLESALPALGDVFCIAQSYRAERTLSRRHLTEFTHCEAECPFITFEDLLNNIEDLVCDVTDRILKSPYASYVHDLHPEFKPPKRPFRRMNYTDAIVWLKENNVTKDDGTFYEFGDEISESPERKIVDTVNEPILLCKFPGNIKCYDMLPCADDGRLTESVDLLLPGVGEVVGGSMRVWDLKQLEAGYRRDGVDSEQCYWYTDQRRYGSCPHGGYGLGVDRFICWILNRYHVYDTCLYPRFFNRCKP